MPIVEFDATPIFVWMLTLLVASVVVLGIAGLRSAWSHRPAGPVDGAKTLVDEVDRLADHSPRTLRAPASPPFGQTSLDGDFAVVGTVAPRREFVPGAHLVA